MSIPSLSIQSQGLNQVSADNYNTYLQGCNVVTDLRNFVGVTGIKVFMAGYTAIGDGGEGIFYWNASGSAPDDSGVTTIVPNGAAAGEWSRLTGGSTVASNSSIFPMGRLTLITGTPVMNSDQTAKTNIYYTPYIGSLIPISNGVGFISYPFSQITLALDSNSGHTGYQQSGKLFDIFAFLINGAPVIGTGPAWASSTARGTGAGTTQLTALNGLWTNTVSINLKSDATASQTTVGVGQATYLGTMYATANGQTGTAFKPIATAGGANNIIGIWNAYNRIKTSAICRDSTTGWTYGTATFRSMDGSVNNRISIIDGLAQISIKSHVQCTIGSATAGLQIIIGTNLNSTSAQPNVIGLVQSPTATLADNYEMLVADESFYPSLGFNFYQAVEYANGSTATFNPVSGTQALIIDTEY